MEDVDERASIDLTDESSFVASVRPYWPLMRRVAERLAGRTNRDDVLQEALADAWRYRDRFDPRRGSLQSWLLSLTANRARKALRIRRTAEELEDVAVTSSPPNLDLQRAIERLPRRAREAVHLFYFVGLSVADTAATMGCAEGTVKSTLSAARASLHDSLAEERT